VRAVRARPIFEFGIISHSARKESDPRREPLNHWRWYRRPCQVSRVGATGGGRPNGVSAQSASMGSCEREWGGALRGSPNCPRARGPSHTLHPYATPMCPGPARPLPAFFHPATPSHRATAPPSSLRSAEGLDSPLPGMLCGLACSLPPCFATPPLGCRPCDA